MESSGGREGSDDGREPRSEGTLRLDGVARVLGERTVLEDITLEVSPGEVVGLLGRNGAGKTTLLRLAGGILAASAGRIRLGEDEIGALSRRELARRVALVPQDLHVPFPFRVGELVLMGRTPHRPFVGLEGPEDVARARAALAKLGIEALVDRSIATLSGGERQLVLFARALVQDPQLLLLDEPTAFLDLKHRVEVLAEVRAFAASGRAALVVSHDLSLAARSCDRLVLLGGGGIVAEGPPASVLTAEHIQRAYDIEAEPFDAPDGARVVVPRIPSA